MQSIPPTTAKKQTQTQMSGGRGTRELLRSKNMRGIYGILGYISAGSQSAISAGAGAGQPGHQPG